jgi:hypothetical protein
VICSIFKVFIIGTSGARDASYPGFLTEGPEERESISNVSETLYQATRFKLSRNVHLSDSLYFCSSISAQFCRFSEPVILPETARAKTHIVN